MKPAWIIACVLGMVLVSCGQRREVCAVCQRDECAGFAFHVMLDNGRAVETCCPRCGLHYVQSEKQHVRSMSATDFQSGKLIDATRAFYLSGSGLSHCSGQETRRDAYGCCYYKGFDRCLPSLVAFETREAAEASEKQHGGEIVAFGQLSVN